mgnify:CR=1 FL=1
MRYQTSGSWRRDHLLFVRTVRIQSQALLGMDSDIVGKLTLLSDILMKNGEMWLTLIAFIVVVLAVNLIRTRMFDYAWRIAIVAGGVIYIVIMLAGSMSLGISISVFSLIIYYCGCGTGWNHTGVLCVWWRLYKNGTSGI